MVNVLPPPGKKIRMKMTDQDKPGFNKARRCYVRNESFNEENNQRSKVRDHDRSTGCYRGELRIASVISVTFLIGV